MISIRSLLSVRKGFLLPSAIPLHQTRHRLWLSTQVRAFWEADKPQSRPQQNRPRPSEHGKQRPPQTHQQRPSHQHQHHGNGGNQNRFSKQQQQQRVPREFTVSKPMTVKDIAMASGHKVVYVKRKVADMGIDLDDDLDVLDMEICQLVLLELGVDAKLAAPVIVDAVRRPPPTDPNLLKPRPPVVTIMGHVDHGKTTLLDALRSSSIAAGEAGGITQHIGAFSVQLPSGRTITFFDTPGHEAFSNMRSRGASVTDLVILVVAADDGVKPQTIEAIRHAQSANVGIIVAINKCDKEGTNPRRVKEELLRHGVQLEDFGGDVQAIEISALKKKNLDLLEEAVLLQADLMELKADFDGHAEGVIIEAKVVKGRGFLATMLVQRGSLKRNAIVVAGTTWAKVKSITDDKGRSLNVATPGMAVELIGWRDLPGAGDTLLQVESEERAREVVDYRLSERRQRTEEEYNELIRARQQREKQEYNEVRQQLSMLSRKRREIARAQVVRTDYASSMESGEQQSATNDSATSSETEASSIIPARDFPVIIKGDAVGTLEALNATLSVYKNKELGVRVLGTGLGGVTESDITRAATCKGAILAFGVDVPGSVRNEAKKSSIEIISSNIIYQLLEQLKKVMGKQLDPVKQTKVVGEAEVLQIFNSSRDKKQINIAGCRVKDGTLQRNLRFRVLRDEQVIHEGPLATMKHLKKDVETVNKGTECGLAFEDFNDFKSGDYIQALKDEMVHVDFVPAS